MTLTPTLLALVAAGGALGALGRVCVSVVLQRWLGGGFPWGTLAVNALGGLLMGLAFVILGPERRLAFAFAGAGVLGGFTTFSAFSLEVYLMLDRGALGLAAGYAAASAALAVGGLALGVALGRAL